MRRGGSRLLRRQGLPEESVPDLGNCAIHGDGRLPLRVTSQADQHQCSDPRQRQLLERHHSEWAVRVRIQRRFVDHSRIRDWHCGDTDVASGHRRRCESDRLEQHRYHAKRGRQVSLLAKRSHLSDRDVCDPVRRSADQSRHDGAHDGGPTGVGRSQRHCGRLSTWLGGCPVASPLIAWLPHRQCPD